MSGDDKNDGETEKLQQNEEGYDFDENASLTHNHMNDEETERSPSQRYQDFESSRSQRFSINFSNSDDADAFLSERSAAVLNAGRKEATWMLRRSFTDSPNDSAGYLESTFDENVHNSRSQDEEDEDEVNEFLDTLKSRSSISRASSRSSYRYMEEASVEASLVSNEQNDEEELNRSKVTFDPEIKPKGHHRRQRSLTKIHLPVAGKPGHRRTKSEPDSILISREFEDPFAALNTTTLLEKEGVIISSFEDEIDVTSLHTSKPPPRKSSSGDEDMFMMDASERHVFHPITTENRKELIRQQQCSSPMIVESDEEQSQEQKPTKEPIQFLPPTRQRASSSSRVNLFDLYSSMSVSQILAENQILSCNEQKLNHMDTEKDQESWLLYSLFEGFCTPAVSLKSCADILEMERQQKFKDASRIRNIQLPEQPVITQSAAITEVKDDNNTTPQKKNLVVSMLQTGATSNHKSLPALLQLPIYFSAAFLRILIRLLSHETDSEYNSVCLLTLPWKDGSNVKKIDLKDDPTPDPDHSTRRPHLQYSVTRFQCTWLSTLNPQNESPELNETRPAIQTILRIWERLSGAPPQHQRLLPPLSRLIGLLSIAGSNPSILRRIMTLASQQQPPQISHGHSTQQQAINDQQQYVVARLCLLRALKTAAAGASRSSLLPKSAPKSYFSFGCGSSDGNGMRRTISGLSAWPFRNDFGMSLWFRAEQFNDATVESSHPLILFSVQTDEGAGIEISLVPIDDNEKVTSSSVRTIAVSIYNADYSSGSKKSNRTPAHYIKVPSGCVLLPQVWYHVAVRHTRSRMKGVFSLATRQQLSIMLDGKTMLTEPLSFPIVSDADFSDDLYSSAQAASSLLKNSFRRTPQMPATLNITLTFGQNFEGQTGALYVFNDNVSDASFRALYELTGGSVGRLKRTHSLGETWDARHSDIVKRSRVLDVNITSDDADEIVLSQRRQSGYMKKVMAEKCLPVVDMGESDEQEESDFPSDLQKAAFGSKIFISWDPRRTLGSLGLELHIGAHVNMEGVFSWRSNSVQDVISSVGGVQALIPIFRSFLGGDIERFWASSNTPKTDAEESRERVYTVIPDLIFLLAAFVQDHNDNARELLRCGGIDVIEQLFHSSKKLALGKAYNSSVFSALNSEIGLSCLLIHALLSLRSACSHYVGIETKVYSRLLFNIPLWLGSSDQICGAALHLTLLPVLSSLTKMNPEKVRACVGVKDMVLLLKEYSNCSVHGSEEDKVDRFIGDVQASNAAVNSLSCLECMRATNVLLAMIFYVISIGTSPQDLSPFLSLVSSNLESEWEAFLLKGDRKYQEELQKTTTHKVNKCSCTLLLFLFQIRPRVPGLYESFAHCCGGVQGGAGWILCAMVNSFDDEIRAIGIRCLAAYLDATSRGADASLSLGSGISQSSTSNQKGTGSDVSSIVRLSSTRFTQLAKGIAAMSPGVRSIVLTPSKLTARVVYKLLWHLLKGQRSNLGGKTRAALASWITVSEGLSASSIASFKKLHSLLIIPLETKQPGIQLAVEWTEEMLSKNGIKTGKSMRNPLAISMILRLLRYLKNDAKDQWLTDILLLIRSNRKCVSLLASLPDWQPCLFPLISETLELVCSEENHPNISGKPIDLLDTQSLDLQTTAEANKLDKELLHKRLDLCLDLYSTLLGHLVREGGDPALESVERAASLQRTCVNGHDVLLLILGSLCDNVFEHGSLLEMGSLSAQDWKGVDLEQDSPLLKQSARLVTDAILSNGIKGLNMPAAVRSWRGLRHLTEVIVAVITKSSFGAVDLFDYAHQKAASIDSVSGGLYGIRLPETKLTGVRASDYAECLRITCSISSNTENDDERKREIDRRLCVRLAAQILAILDAFIFPQSPDESLPMTQIDSLALVRNSEVRLGTFQGPLISSAIRLSFLLLALLEPCSVTFLQCASRLRCLLCWALELIRESANTDGNTPPFHKDGVAHIDRLVLAIVLHCHRALGRCSSLLSEIESTSYEKYFQSGESQRKFYRRLLRVALELREIVSTAYRGRNDLLQTTLSTEALEALRESLEGVTAAVKPSSKESIVKDFLRSTWVSDFQDCETRAGLSVPEQVPMAAIPLSSNQESQPGLKGFAAIEKLALESNNIVTDFERAIDSCFKEYLEEHQRWTETDAVRDLEYEGDNTIKRFSDKFRAEHTEYAKFFAMRRSGADNRWKAIQRKVADPWKIESHWKLARYTDILGRRILLVQNQCFNDHVEASYELALGKEREREEQKRQQRLLEKNALSEVMRRNAEAFTVPEADQLEGKDDESSMLLTSDSESMTDAESSAIESEDDPDRKRAVNITLDEIEQDEGWDKIDSEEIKDVDAEGDTDAWAKAFIWSENETVVARFESIMIVSLQSYVEGKALLTTHGIFFCQKGDEINVMTREPIEGNESYEGKCRRWRLTRLTEVHGRRFMLRPQALELFFSDSHELLLNFPGGVKDRDRFYAKIRHSCKVPMLWSTRSLNPRLIFKKTKLTEQWKKRRISNFEYIMALNRMAGRSFNDLTQYPVFPWVLADYTSESVDIQDSRVFRDLSKPVGALNPDRLAQLLERYKDLELFGFSEAEKFLYGSHYSSPGIVLHFMIRQEPFTTMAIDLQSGRFDCPDRLFFDISESWNSCLTSSADMKELIPEFFTLPEMFLNNNKFPLGTTQSGRIVDDVGLPPWAKGSAHEFVRINRLALESEYVSRNLHHWIDLVFGYKQRGPEAERAHNIFHHLSYEGSVDLDKIVDEVDRNAAESHIQNFGQTPSQLSVVEPHPCRYSIDDCWKPLLSGPLHSRNLKCHTPAKQFANKRSEDAKGAALKIHVFSDTVIVIYADMSVGSYRWIPTHKSNRLRMEKLRPLSRRDLSTSRVAMKRGSVVSPQTMGKSSLAIGNWSFGITVGGLVKEELRRKEIMPSGRLISTNETSLSSAEASALVISCGYWDETIKAHCADNWRLVASQNGGHRGPIKCLAIGQDGGLMVTGGQDGTCRVWVVDHPDMSVALSDGYVQTALGGSNDGDQVLSCCHVLWGHDSPITCVGLDSDLDVVLSGSQSGLICVHTLRRGEFIRSFRPQAIKNRNLPGAVRKLVMGSSGLFVVQMEDLGLHTFTVNAVRLRSVDAGEALNDIVVSSTGEILVSGGDRGHVLIRSVFDLDVCSMLDLSRHGPIRSITLTPSDLNPIRQYLFVGSDDGMITIVEEDHLADQKDNQTISF